MGSRAQQGPDSGKVPTPVRLALRLRFASCCASSSRAPHERCLFEYARRRRMNLRISQLRYFRQNPGVSRTSAE